MAFKSQPPFYIQISDADGRIITTRTGGKHERDLIESFVEAIVANKVGVFRTEAHVKQAIRDGITKAISDLKIKNPFDVV